MICWHYFRNMLSIISYIFKTCLLEWVFTEFFDSEIVLLPARTQEEIVMVQKTTNWQSVGQQYSAKSFITK